MGAGLGAFNFFISGVAASVSEWQLIHSLTLAATTRSSRSKLRGIEPIANIRGASSSVVAVPPTAGGGRWNQGVFALLSGGGGT
jgi:hypothetical protein